jgi:hypothetical protein
VTAFLSEPKTEYSLPNFKTVQSYTLRKYQEHLPGRSVTVLFLEVSRRLQRTSEGNKGTTAAVRREISSGLLQHPFRVIRRNARHLPEIPSGRRSSHLAHGNQAIGRRLLQSPFPSRDDHRRALEMLSEIELIEPKFLSQCSNPPRPCWQGRGHELAGPGHTCLQDNKSLHILRRAHFPARSIDWNRGVGLPLRSLDRLTTKAAHRRQPKQSPTIYRVW